MPSRAFAELEDVRRVIGLGPGFGQVGLERLRPGLHGGARLDLDEAAVTEGHRLHGGEGHRLLRIEVDWGDVDAEAEGAAALRRLRLGGTGIEHMEAGAGRARRGGDATKL